jgi:hypothetical protein
VPQGEGGIIIAPAAVAPAAARVAGTVLSASVVARSADHVGLISPAPAQRLKQGPGAAEGVAAFGQRAGPIGLAVSELAFVAHALQDQHSFRLGAEWLRTVWSAIGPGRCRWTPRAPPWRARSGFNS